MDKVFAHALTIPARVKALLGLETNDMDNLIVQIINSVTAFIEGECGGRRFLERTYTNDTYSIYGNRQKYLVLRQTPIKSITSLQYRAGTPDTPNWTNFITNQYELIDPSPIPGNESVLWYPTGVVRVYGIMPRIYNNSVRATYVAGYKIDWTNAGDPTKHELPLDLTRVAENIVVRWFKRRDFAGKSSQSLEGSSISWDRELDKEDKSIIARYQKVPYIC